MIHGDRMTAVRIEVLDNGFLVNFMEAVKYTGPSDLRDAIAEKVRNELDPRSVGRPPEYTLSRRTFYCKDQAELNVKVAEAVEAFKRLKMLQGDGLLDRYPGEFL